MHNDILANVTLSGLPLVFELDWPFHPSTSGGDFQVLHGSVSLADGSQLKANVAIHLSATMLELLPSLDAAEAQPYVLNALRKWTDRKELEFLKSGKLQPVQLSSRFKNFSTGGWHFESATDAEIEQLLKDKLYWVAGKITGAPVALNDPADALYLGTSTAKLAQAGDRLHALGLLQSVGTLAVPTEALLALSHEFETRASKAFENLQMKHAFESVKGH
ncbi:MAG TPA: hypothetical protein VEG32_06245 [Clostridia bacterium]|nr:hypothetical protein [Clostridia bacterium]